ncbi:hypothetical protein Tco_0359108 [Tanacetum coccineum]
MFCMILGSSTSSKDDDQSSKKPRESDASSTKQHPALTSTGWQITDTRDAGADSSMHRSDPESEHSEQSSDDIPMQDEGNDSDMEDTDNAHIPKGITGKYYATTYKVPEENSLQRKSLYWVIPSEMDFAEEQGKKKLCKLIVKGPAFQPCGKEQKIALSYSKAHAIVTETLAPLEELVPSLWVETPSDREASQMTAAILSVFSVRSVPINIQEKLNICPKTDKTSLHTDILKDGGWRWKFTAPQISSGITEMLQTRHTFVLSYERPHKGVKASANSDVMYFFTSAQDGNPVQDDVRLCLSDDLKKAQDHSQGQV